MTSLRDQPDDVVAAIVADVVDETSTPGLLRPDDQRSIARGGETSPAGHGDHDPQGKGAGRGGPFDSLQLQLAAAFLDDVEGLRKATENRSRKPTPPTKCGHCGDCGACRSFTDRSWQWMALQASGAGMQWEQHGQRIAELEDVAIRALRKALRDHPLGPWVRATTGIGEKQGARLIAAIGDPYWNLLEDRPRRGPAELWAYCGQAPGQRRMKGTTSNWNADAKMRAHLCSEAAVKAGVRKLDGCDDADGYDVAGRQAITPYGERYLRARASWAGREVCDAHKNQHALHCVAKEITKDLWRAARDAHAA